MKKNKINESKKKRSIKKQHHRKFMDFLALNKYNDFIVFYTKITI